MEDMIFKITPQVEKLSAICEDRDRVAPELYGEHQVMRGLRDLNGKGVLAGLTNISEVYAKKKGGWGVGSLSGTAVLPRL